jgi:hypothetical protein
MRTGSSSRGRPTRTAPTGRHIERVDDVQVTVEHRVGGALERAPVAVEQLPRQDLAEVRQRLAVVGDVEAGVVGDRAGMNTDAGRARVFSTKRCLTHWWPTPPGFAVDRICTVTPARSSATSRRARENAMYSYIVGVNCVSSSKPTNW